MTLQVYTLALGNFRDDTSGNNYAANTPVYILNSGGTLADIFRDQAGAQPIAQDGLNNISDAYGEFTFYVNSGQYISRVAGRDRLINVVGSDYFDSRVDDAVEQITQQTMDSRGFRVVGTFADGFTYELFNDVGIDADGNSWIYVGSGAPNKVVSAGIVPSAVAGYEQVTFNSLPAINVTNANGGSVQDFIDNLSGSDVSDSRGTNVQDYIDGNLTPFKSISDMKAAAFLSTLPEFTRVEWQGYYAQSDGGSNWGVLRFGAHTEDGGSIFSIDTNTYIEANLPIKFSAIKFGAGKSGSVEPELQGALDYIRVRGSGGVLTLCGRSFQYSKLSVLNTDNLTIRGVGDAELVTTTVVNSREESPFDVVNSSNFKVESLTIRSVNGTSGLVSETLLRLVDSGNAELYRVKILSRGGYSVPVIRSSHLSVIRCKFFGSSLWLMGSPYCKVKGSHFENSLYDSIKATSYSVDLETTAQHFSDYLTITGNTFKNVGADAIDLYTRGQKIIITGNIIDGAGEFGVQIKTILRDPSDYGQGGSSDILGYNNNVIVSGNEFYNCTINSVVVKMDDLRASPTFEINKMPFSISIANNIMEGGERCIYLRDCTGVKVSGNTISGASDSGIFSSNRLSNSSINDNNVSNCPRGIFVAPSITRDAISICNNTVTDCPTVGINARIVGGSVSVNVVRGCGDGLILSLVYSSASSNASSDCGVAITVAQFTGSSISLNTASASDTGFKFLGSEYNSRTGALVGNISMDNTVELDNQLVDKTNFKHVANTFDITV